MLSTASVSSRNQHGAPGSGPSPGVTSSPPGGGLITLDFQHDRGGVWSLVEQTLHADWSSLHMVHTFAKTTTRGLADCIIHHHLSWNCFWLRKSLRDKRSEWDAGPLPTMTMWPLQKPGTWLLQMFPPYLLPIRLCVHSHILNKYLCFLPCMSAMWHKAYWLYIGIRYC